MDFRIADTFTDSLARLTGDERKAVRTITLELHANPAGPGLGFHKLDKAKDENLWSVRAGAGLRLIVHKTQRSLLLCYVDHQDNAYNWAERQKLETHPKTGAAQLVEIRETVKEIKGAVDAHAEFAAAPESPIEYQLIFSGKSDEELLRYGVPAEWLGDVRKATERSILTLVDHLPAEAAEALLELAIGGKPRVPQRAFHTLNPFTHPDAQRRFRLMTNGEELQRALDSPLEKWTVFLHPEQRQWVERDFAGPARVSGSAGTGKTVVALHRTAHLARTHPDARILLTTFSDTLARALRVKLRRLLINEPSLAKRIEVQSINAIGHRLYKTHLGPATIVSDGVLRELLRKAAGVAEEHAFGFHFLLAEWEMVDAWQMETWEVYREVVRLGRKTRLSEARGAVLWSICERVRAGLRTRKLITHAELFTSLAAVIEKQKKAAFDFVVVDEAQDVSVPQFRFIAALGGGRANALFFAGDFGQRIFQRPFSWNALGVDIRGRSRTLRVNYRTTHQIRAEADRLLGPALADVDGNSANRRDTVSVFNGPAPAILSLKSKMEESRAAGDWIAERARGGLLPHEIGVFIRSAAQLDRACAAVDAAGMALKVLEEPAETISGHVSICTMDLARGLEFRAVVVMACDDGVMPLRERVETACDDIELKEVHDTERHLLYVACTRARDHLLITSVAPPSEYLSGLLK